MAKTTPGTFVRCIQGGTVLDPRTGIEYTATYREIYPADQHLVRLVPHLFCEVGREDQTADPVAVALSATAAGSNGIEMNPQLVRPHPPGVWWR